MKKVVHWWTNTSLILKILVGIILGAALALLVPGQGYLEIIGNVFVGALKALAPVLVALLVLSSIARAGGKLGSRFRTVVILYMLTTLIASIMAVVASKVFPVELALVGDGVEQAAPSALGDVFKTLFVNVVANPIAAVSEGNYIGILFWAILVGLALRKFAKDSTRDMMEDLAGAVSRVVSWVIQFAPFGIFGIVYSSVSTGGLEIFTSYGKLLLVLVGTMLLCSLVINPIIVAILLKRNPYPLVLRCLRESGLQAFFTRSSAANIPVNMALCEKLGLDKEFYSVSIPLGSTINMDGAAITIAVMSLAAAYTVGIDVPFILGLLLCVIATLGACGASGVAGGSLLLIPMACSFLGVSNDVAMQVVAVGFIIGVIQDSVETALNSSGDVIFTATSEYYERRKKKEEMNFLGEFAKKKN